MYCGCAFPHPSRVFNCTFLDIYSDNLAYSVRDQIMRSPTSLSRWWKLHKRVCYANKKITCPNWDSKLTAVLTLENKVYRVDCTCFLICHLSHLLPLLLVDIEHDTTVYANADGKHL
jgi:hypothetical protein